MLDKLNALLEEKRATIVAEGRSKGTEKVASGVVAGQDANGPRVTINGREYLNLASNNYLGLSQHPKLAAADHEAVERYGVGPGAVRFITGTQQPHILLEEKLAAFHDTEAAMIYSSAYSANCGVMAPLLDDQSIVISDELNHNSIIFAIKLAGLPRERKKIYQHSDMAALRKCLEESVGQAERVMIATDGVFSMRGDLADLPGIVALADEYDAKFPGGVYTFVDDSHGTGAIGARGRGTMEQVGEERIDIITSTLGKALGVNGGYVASSASVVEYLREVSPFYVYSNPITAGEAQSAIASIEIIDGPEGPELLAKVRENAAYFRSAMEEAGFELVPGVHPIVPVLVKDPMRAQTMVAELFEKGMLVVKVSYPVVPRGQDTIRVQISAAHTKHDLDLAFAAFSEVGKNQGLIS